MMLTVGAASWNERSLSLSGWYPAACRDSASRLSFYARRFGAVELDTTFYAIPDPEVIYRWIARTPLGFKFHVKCLGLFTFHSLSPATLPVWAREEIRSSGDRLTWREVPRAVRLKLWERFIAAVTPLRDAGKMGYLLFQLPPRLAFSRRMLTYVDRMAELTSGFRSALEIRHPSWLAEPNRAAFLKALERRGVALVASDSPRPDRSGPSELIRTAGWGTVVRLCGRRSVPAGEPEGWRHDYSDEELYDWKCRILAVGADDCAVIFANCWRDRAVRDAARMAVLMGLSGIVGPRQEELAFESDE